MTAATIAEPVLIHYKVTVQLRKSEAERAEELRDLARSDTPDAATECAVRTWAHPSLIKDGDATEAMAAYRQYRSALQTADGIESGAIPWQDYAPYTCGDRKEQAWWDACGEVDGHMRVLLGGHGAARHIHSTGKAGA